MKKEKKVINKQVYPILLAFLCMGFGDAVGPFVSLAKEKFDLTHFESQLIAFFGFIMFFLLSIQIGRAHV
jgi:MFS transporter, FHS family, L-fucose permease